MNSQTDGKPLEDRIEEARLAGTAAPHGSPNPYKIGLPEHDVWATAHAQKPAGDPFDTPEGIAEAAIQGVRHAQAGPGFVSPFPIGTARRRAWQKAYNETPKGVPQMNGPKGRSESDMIRDHMRDAVELAAGAAGVSNLTPLNDAARSLFPAGVGDTSIDPVEKAKADAYVQGERAKMGWGNGGDTPANPYHPLLSPIESESWQQGWNDQVEVERASREKAERVGDLSGGNVVLIPGELSPCVTQIAVAVFPHFLGFADANVTGKADIHAVASTMAFNAAEALVNEFNRRKQSGKPV